MREGRESYGWIGHGGHKVTGMGGRKETRKLAVWGNRGCVFAFFIIYVYEAKQDRERERASQRERGQEGERERGHIKSVSKEATGINIRGASTMEHTHKHTYMPYMYSPSTHVYNECTSDKVLYM